MQHTFDFGISFTNLQHLGAFWRPFYFIWNILRIAISIVNIVDGKKKFIQ